MSASHQLSELGDKTFLISAILAMRHSPLLVFWGCWSAMIAMSVLSSLMGALLPALLSPRAAHLICALLFTAFGVYTLYQAYRMSGDEILEEWKEAQAEIRSDEAAHELHKMENGEAPGYPNVMPYPAVASHATLDAATSTGAYLREGARNLCGLLLSPVFSQAFLLSFLGEWGDRSQISTMALAATHVRTQTDAARHDRGGRHQPRASDMHRHRRHSRRHAGRAPERAPLYVDVLTQ